MIQKSTFDSAGNVVYLPKQRTRLIMSERPNDGTVAMYYGEVDDGDFLSAEEHLPTLPNTVSVIVQVKLCCR